MPALKTLPDLTDHELFDLVRLCAKAPDQNSPFFLIALAGDLRRRKFTATEDYVIKLAADLVNHA